MGLFGNDRKIEYRVPDMNCGHCETKIIAAVQGLPEIKKVRATSSDKRLVIHYSGADAPDLDAVNGALEPAGYRAEPIG